MKLINDNGEDLFNLEIDKLDTRPLAKAIAILVLIACAIILVIIVTASDVATGLMRGPGDAAKELGKAEKKEE